MNNDFGANGNTLVAGARNGSRDAMGINQDKINNNSLNVGVSC
jgi:hypothetical protein